MSGGADRTLPHRPAQKRVFLSAVIRAVRREACPGRGIQYLRWDCFSRQRLSYVHAAFRSDRASFACWCRSF
jgi:hypothetical protein